jgi:phytoene synthase
MKPLPLSSELLGKARNSSFGPAALLLPPRARRGMRVLYAFCREIDDAVDEPEGGGLALLEKWRRFLKSLAGHRTPQMEGELMREVAWLCQDFQVSPGLLEELVDGAGSDLRRKVRFRTFGHLRKYCRQVAGSVGEACLPLFDCQGAKAREFADTLGLGFQLINILRDVSQDLDRDRIYFAAEDLRRFGVTERELRSGLDGPASSQLFAEYGRRAEDCLARARELRKGLSGKLKPADLMADVYGALLEVMKRDGYRVLEKRCQVSGWRKRWLFLKRALS